jgi:hypothetical protein
MKHLHRLAGVIAVFTIALALGPSSASASSRADAFDQVKRLGRGVNILGYDPV